MKIGGFEMEYAIGTRITLEDGRVIGVVEAPNKLYRCDSCIFEGTFECCESYKCSEYDRTDHKNIIYKEIKEADSQPL